MVSWYLLIVVRVKLGVMALRLRSFFLKAAAAWRRRTPWSEVTKAGARHRVQAAPEMSQPASWQDGVEGEKSFSVVQVVWRPTGGGVLRALQ